MDYSKINKQFDTVYDAKIVNCIKPVEELQKKHKRIYGVLAIFNIVFILLFLIIYYTELFNEYNQIILYVEIFLLVASIIYGACLSNKFRKITKENILMAMFSVFGKFSYSKKPIISVKEIRELGLFRKASSQKNDDIIIGKYKDIEISITETELTHNELKKVSSQKREMEKVVDFSGLILKIKMNKNFIGHTVVRQKPMSYEHFCSNIKSFQQKNSQIISEKMLTLIENPLVKLGFQGMQLLKQHDVDFSKERGISIDFSNNNKPRKLEEVSLEDTEFMKIFDIFSNDQVEARYLLTPSFMERLKSISSVMLVMGVHCVFKDGYIILFLDNPIQSMIGKSRGFFEIEPIRGTFYDKEIYRKVFVELITIFDFIYHFKLNEKIGL